PESRHTHVTLARFFFAEHQLEDRSLAGAGVAGEEDEFSAADMEGHLIERRIATGWVALAHLCEANHPLSPCVRSAIRSAVSSHPHERRRNPSGTPNAARSEAESALCDVSRGSEMSDSTPARDGACVITLSRPANFCAACAPPARTSPT